MADLVGAAKTAIAQASRWTEYGDCCLMPFYWKDDVPPSRGSPTPQDTIFEDMDGCDWYLAIIGGTLGSPTGQTTQGEFLSGVRAEFIYAHDRREHFTILMVYFLSDRARGIDPDELRRIEEFRRELRDKNVLYKELDTAKDFPSVLRDDLLRAFLK